MLTLATALGSLLALSSAVAEAPSGDVAARDNVRGFEYQVREIKGKTRERMVGVSWHQGCPVDLDRLRLIRTTFWDFHGDRETGSIVVHKDESGEIVRVFRSLYRHEFKIRRMHLIDRYGGDDHASMNADNTSGFNCRYVAGTSTWSQHAYGKAIDLNPSRTPT